MSHNVNYGDDRLANYVFTKLIYLISTWTKLSFSQNQETVQLAKRYFDQYYPEEKMPIFTVSFLFVKLLVKSFFVFKNPCNDRVLMNLWVGNESLCRFFPRFLIIGPQKTGSSTQVSTKYDFDQRKYFQVQQHYTRCYIIIQIYCHQEKVQSIMKRFNSSAMIQTISMESNGLCVRMSEQ